MSSWRTRSARPTARSSPRSMSSWPRAVMRTSYWASRARTCSSFLPSRVRRSNWAGTSTRRVIVVAWLRCLGLRGQDITPPGSGRRRRQVEPNVELAQAPGVHLARRLHQEVLGLLVHGERDDLADVPLLGEQHDDAVDARRRATVGRRAVLERSEHAAEPALHLLAAIAGDLEGLVHDVGTVVPDRAARQLDPVADDVVLVGLDRQGVLSLEGLEPPLRHRERVVAEDDLLGVGVPLVHGKVRDPAEAERVLLDEVQLLAEPDAQLAGQRVRGLGLVADEEDHVARGGARGLAEGGEALGI